ncbi:MAG: type IV toxin-antitoxin system AbiEi family antitoxin, partial [Microbacterium sp.]|uniref:type IV toxin-antitoxin system AbiEi family antitoxin n=1 Tax=Microbacterium sp. TaxID=51671 RepID=UPI003F9D0817
ALVSTIATTALDVATDTLVAGGLDNAATVIIELSEHPSFDEDDIARAAYRYPVTTARRLGWILENLAGTRPLDALHTVGNRGSQNPSRLNPSRSLTGVIDKRWNLSINDEIEDES